MRRVAVGLAVLLAALALIGALDRAGTSRAEFPGQNGSIAFEGARDSSSFDVYVYSGGTITNLTNNPGSPITLSANPAWSPDGTKIAYSHDGNIHVMNADGTGSMELTTAGTDFNPDWSPDGTKIVFERTAIGSGEIYVMDADGDNETNITNTAGVFDQSPSWAPDGSRIAFSTNRDGNFEIYVMDPDGSDPTRLTSDAVNDREPDWSPDSSKIVYSRSGIYTMNANGSSQTQISSSGQSPVWSPDSTKIAFVLSTDIYVMDVDGSDQINLTNHTAPEGEPSWQSAAAGSSGTINGTVYESPSGVMRGATVTLQPLGLQTTTSVSDGSFSFSGVSFGSYTLVVTSPSCTPFGCYKAVAVNHASSKTTVSIYPNFFTPTPIPTPTPIVVGGVTELPDARGGGATAALPAIAGAAGGVLALAAAARWARRAG